MYCLRMVRLGSFLTLDSLCINTTFKGGFSSYLVGTSYIFVLISVSKLGGLNLPYLLSSKNLNPMTFRPVPFHLRDMSLKHIQTEITILFSQKVKPEKHRVVLLESVFVLFVVEYIGDIFWDGTD